MGVLDLLRRRGQAEEEERDRVLCGHLVLTPTWDNAGDMGKEDRATGYRCYACGESMSVERAKQLREGSAISL